MCEITKIMHAVEISRAQQQAQQVADAAKNTIGSNTFVFYAGTVVSGLFEGHRAASE